MGKASATPSPQAAIVPFSPDLTGPSEFCSITSRKETDAEYKLDDGTTLRVRPVIIDVRRLTGQWQPDGDPVYVTKIGFAISTQAPAALRRGAAKALRLRRRKVKKTKKKKKKENR
jgi:hypothetical protein